jgi:hypothetical protein
MKYVNPFLFLQQTTGNFIDANDSQALAMAKKKLLAEVELSSTQTITFKEVQYTKNDILNIFESIQTPTSLSYHSVIANDPALLLFLQTGILKNNARFQKEATYKEPAFLTFIAPFYETVFTNLLLKCFQQQDTRVISDLLKNPILLNGEYKEKSYSRVFRYLNEKKSSLSGIHQQLQLHQPIDKVVLETLTGINMVCLLNYLPLEFQVFRDEYAIQMFDVSMALKRTDGYWAKLVLGNIRQLNSSSIVFPEEPVEPPVEYSNNSSSSDGGSVVGLIVAIIVIVIRIASCNSH